MSKNLNLHVYNFARHRMGDKINACYQLCYEKEVNGKDFLIIDPLSHDPFSFPVKYFFPQIGDFVIENCADGKSYDELYQNLIAANYPTVHLGNLWVSAPSLKQDTGYLPQMHIPYFIKELQKNLVFKDPITMAPLNLKDYGCIIVNHCLLNAGYNVGRNHTHTQWMKLFDDLKATSPHNILIIDIPKESIMSASEIMGLIDLCDIYVGGDTGFTHAAAALGKEIVAIYGPNEHDVKAFEKDKIAMNASHSWCSDPITNKYQKFVMENNLFQEKEVFEYLLQLINKQIKDELRKI